MLRICCLFALGMSFVLSLADPAESQGKKKPKTGVWSDQKDRFGDPLPFGAVARIGTVRYRAMTGLPDFPVLSNDGKYLAVNNERDELIVWELPAWTKYRSFNRRSIDKKKSAQYQGAAFTPDSKQLVTFDASGQQIVFFDLAGNKVARTIVLAEKQGWQLPFFSVSIDQERLIVSSQVPTPNGQAYEFAVVDLKKGKVTQSFKVEQNRVDVGQFTVSSDGRRMAHTYAKDNNAARVPRVDAFIEIWDLDAGKSIKKIETDFALRHLTYSPDGKWLAASNGQSTLRIYDAAAGTEKHYLRLRRSEIDHLAFSADSKHLYAADMDGTISRFDVASGDRTDTYRSPINEPVRRIAFAADGKALALAQGLDAFFYWEIASGKVLSPTGVPGSMIAGLKFAANGELFVASEEGMMAWWNPRTAVKLRDVKLEHYMDSMRLGGGIGIIDGPEGRLRDRFANFSSVMMSPNNEVVITLDGGAISFYDVKTGKLLYDDDLQASVQAPMVFLNGGTKVAGAQHKKVRVWNSKTGRDTLSFDLPIGENEQIFRIAVTDNGKYFAVATAGNENDANRVILWDAEAKKLVREWPAGAGLESLQFSADGRWLAMASRQDEVRLARVGASKGDYTLPVKAADNDITALALSPDGRQLACAAVVPVGPRDASKIFIFEIASKKVRTELIGHHDGMANHLAFAPDSGLLASGSTDTSVLVWRTGLRAQLAVAPADAADAKEPTAEEIAAWYDVMAGTDAKKAFSHMIKLGQSPKQAIAHLNEKIKAARKPESGEKTIAQWVQDLSSGQFAVRSRATDMLKKLGQTAEMDLKAALPKARDVETRRRIEELLNYLSAYEWSAEEVLHARAVELLDGINTADSRAVLERWATGNPAAVLTQEAMRALQKK